MSVETFIWRSGLLDISKGGVVGSPWVTEGSLAIWRKKTRTQPVKCVGFLTSRVSFCVYKDGGHRGSESRPRTWPLHVLCGPRKLSLDAKDRAG